MYASIYFNPSDSKYYVCLLNTTVFRQSIKGFMGQWLMVFESMRDAYKLYRKLNRWIYRVYIRRACFGLNPPVSL